MELADRTLRDRLEQGAIVFFVLFAIRYYRGSVDLGPLVTVALLVVALVLGFDLVRQRMTD